MPGSTKPPRRWHKSLVPPRHPARKVKDLPTPLVRGRPSPGAEPQHGRHDRRPGSPATGPPSPTSHSRPRPQSDSRPDAQGPLHLHSLTLEEPFHERELEAAWSPTSRSSSGTGPGFTFVGQYHLDVGDDFYPTCSLPPASALLRNGGPQDRPVKGRIRRQDELLPQPRR